MRYVLNIRFNKRDGKNDCKKKMLFLNNEWRDSLFYVTTGYTIGPIVWKKEG